MAVKVLLKGVLYVSDSGNNRIQKLGKLTYDDSRNRSELFSELLWGHRFCKADYEVTDDFLDFFRIKMDVPAN